MRPRRKPYIWPTWISGLISGDKSCKWAVWFKAHFQDYEKTEEEDRDNALMQWKADHAAMVHARAAKLRELGWSATIEDQNKMYVVGQTADVGGKPDIVAQLGSDVLVNDCKTGRQRDSDYWQVLTYMMNLTLPRARFAGRPVTGAVVYPFGVREIFSADLVAGKPRIVAMIHEVAGSVEPLRVPSEAECSRCDIANCPERVAATGVVSVDTTEF